MSTTQTIQTYLCKHCEASFEAVKPKRGRYPSTCQKCKKVQKQLLNKLSQNNVKKRQEYLDKMRERYANDPEYRKRKIAISMKSHYKIKAAREAQAQTLEEV